MIRILALFILLPIVELAILIELGRHVGTAATLAIIVATGALGAYLARSQGLAVLRQMRAEMAAGRLPTESLVDGVIILLAGAVLLTPGILTDLIGFMCLVPAFRRGVKSMLWRRLRGVVQPDDVRVTLNF